VIDLLRYLLFTVVVAMWYCVAACAHGAPPKFAASEQFLPETWPSESQPLPENDRSSDEFVPDEAIVDNEEPMLDVHAEYEEQPMSFWPKPRWFGLRHSSTHGRSIGHGNPRVSTSWMNRPFYIGGELGTLWLNDPIDENISRDIDAFGGVFLGCDFDHYWGFELRFDWATPELKNSEEPDADRSDSLFTWNYGFLYYPWGDSTIRPYWRAGIGNARFDFPLDDGSRHDEWLLTVPFGVGVKYPMRRWLAARAELCDHWTIGNEYYDTQHNLALTFGLEWHFGAHPRSYWPWNPRRHIW
jgi:hypothetical protein